MAWLKRPRRHICLRSQLCFSFTKWSWTNLSFYSSLLINKMAFHSYLTGLLWSEAWHMAGTLASSYICNLVCSFLGFNGFKWIFHIATFIIFLLCHSDGLWGYINGSSLLQSHCSWHCGFWQFSSILPL